MPESKSSMRAFAFAAVAITVAAIVGAGGCSHNTSTLPGPRVTPSPSPSPSGSPTPTPSPTPTANFYVSMAYASMTPTIDPTYGQVDGYALISPPPTPVSSPTPTPSPLPSPTPTQTPGPSGIISVPCNANIQFLNFDKTAFHSASLLVQAPGGGFPSLFNNVNGATASVQLTPISSPAFSTGLLNIFTTQPARSLVYSTGAVNSVLYFGDFENYNSTPSMRTVILVNC
jgi:hypothetical protein